MIGSTTFTYIADTVKGYDRQNFDELDYTFEKLWDQKKPN